LLGSGLVPAAGAPVYGPRGTVGQVVSAAADGENHELLAVLVLDDLAGPLHLDVESARPLTRAPLPYAIPELADAAPDAHSSP
jgi:hypothetical protein